MLNRVNKTNRFKKINMLPDNALTVVAVNSSPDLIEMTAIYSLDKVAQISRFLAGNSGVFGHGCNNSLLYLLHAIDTKPVGSELTTSEMSKLVNAYGQPVESAQTQTSNGFGALKALNCVTGSNGKYRVNANSQLMTELLSRFGQSTRRNLAV